MSYETEVNYNPVEIKLDPLKISEQDMATLLTFVTDTRKRLFIFNIPGDVRYSDILALSARRAILDQTAKTALQSTTSEPQINPLKHALHTPSVKARAGIQIQKSFVLPKQPVATADTADEEVEVTAAPDILLIPLDLDELPTLLKQFETLGIQQIQDTAAQKIKEHLDGFTDGIIPNNLPKGFYIDNEKHALCFTNTPSRFPSALAPVLEKKIQEPMPTLEQAQALLPQTIEASVIASLLNTTDITAQKTALLSVLPANGKEFLNLFQSLKATEVDFIVPLISKMFILGGESHASLFIRLLKTCQNKKLSLDFLQDSEAQSAFLNPRGIKNLQKLLQLPAEQKDWWNTLVNAHLKNEQHQFDFNTFFEAYTQIFLTRIAEKNLTLPNPCPIHHDGHILTTLNRVLDVLEKAQNPQEQCLTLADLNWSPTGVHYAMTQAPESQRFKQVAACMKLENAEDIKTEPGSVYSQLKNEAHDPKPWLFRYMGQNWKKEIRLADIHAQLQKIEQLSTWTTTQKNKLTFILTITFAEKSSLNVENWNKALESCISLLQPLTEVERADLLDSLTRCFLFKPSVSLIQIQNIIVQCVEFKAAFPEKNLTEDFLTPLISCLENEGFELFNTLQERIEKTDPTPEINEYSLTTIATFTTILQNNRENLSADVVTLLSKINEPELAQASIDNLLLALNTLQTKKGQLFSDLMVSILSQINIAKSETLPSLEQIQTLIDTISESTETIPEDLKTSDKQEAWLKDLMVDKNLLPGCVLGNGDISKLDDLIVDAMVEAIKKRSAILKIDKLKALLEEKLQSGIVPKDLKEQLNRDLIPLLDAINALVTLLQSPNPKFEDVIEKMRYFEEVKPRLLQSSYNIGFPLGQSRGDYLLNFILTGKRHENDTITNRLFGTLLCQIHGIMVDEAHAFFNKEENKNLVQDLDANTLLSWFETFNATHSMTFLFKEELVQKKVLPAIRKTLQQLNTQDPIFENSILAAAANLDDTIPADTSLQQYKITIEAIANYLNLLVDIKDSAPAQFNTIYQQLQTGSLARLNYAQKQTLVNNLITAKPDALGKFLKLTTLALEDNPNADSAAIERAINGLVALFELPDLEPETQIMFFKMSMSHNLKSPSPFPMAALSELKKSNLPEQTKSLLIKQVIQILSRMSEEDSPELIQTLVQQTQVFLTQNADLAPLCLALLSRVSMAELSRDLSVYPGILNQLSALNPENREKLASILTGLANRKKDDTVTLPLLLDISKGLGRRSSTDLEQVLQLFATPPYPNAQTLNSALLAHGSEKLQAYCLNFDTNPFIKNGETRAVAKQFATDRIQEALLNLKDLMHGEDLSPTLQLQLAKQLTFIETLGYTDPLNPHDFTGLKKLTASSRTDLKERASTLLNQLRSKEIAPEHIEVTQLELLAYLREIYFRTTGLFPNSTQMLTLLISLNEPSSNLLMRIKTGEGKSLITPMLAILQWSQGGTVDVCTANRTLLARDYENNCEPFFTFLGIKSALIQGNSVPEDYQLDGINCSTLEDMSLFRMAAKESNKESLIQNDECIHLVLDECDDALLDQTTLYKLVAENDQSDEKKDNPAQWIYPMAYHFINLPNFRNTNPENGPIWDEEEDLEQFRLYLNKEINEQFNGDANKQNFMLATTNSQLRQWINASCRAATLIENKHFIVQPVKEKDESGNEVTKKIVCVPLVRSTPKSGCIFTDGVQQALQARLLEERKEQAHYFMIDADPPVLASQSARGLIKFYQNTKGRLLGISGTPGDATELKYLSTILGTQAIGVAPHAGDKRKKHSPVFTFSRDASINAIQKAINQIKRPVTHPTMEINPDDPIQTFEEREAFISLTKNALDQWSKTQTQPILVICEDFEDAQILSQSFEAYKKAGFKIQIVTGKESPEELERIIKQAGRANTITIGTAMLARGIDINPGDHPQGLFVIQTYTDSDRMTTQIAGRAARNGKPGQWLPIYQVNPPENLLKKILYFIFPSYRQRTNQKAVLQLQTEIKSQAAIDRLYTQAIDQAQSTLMQQIQAWEGLLLELYPNDPKLQYELYQWRETLLSELTHAQETSISKNTLEPSIAHFKDSICKLWETVKEEKWVAKAQKASAVTSDQSLRLSYLKQIDLAQELNIQSALQQKSLPFKAGTNALLHQNLEMTILDKAGAFLDYTNPTDEEKDALQLAQIRQLLPSLIGELSAIYPQAIKKLAAKENDSHPSFFPALLSTLVEKFIEQKNKALLKPEDKQEIIREIIEFYQEELKDADASTIQALLKKAKPLIIKHSESLAKNSLVDQFKMQGLILTFSKVYQQSGLPPSTKLNALKTSYDEEIMKKLADHLLHEFAWVKKSPQPPSSFFERTVAKEAAKAIYALAKEVSESPQDEDKIHALYKGLQQQRVILQDRHLFSVRHTNPRNVINVALAAVESLNMAPHCDKTFQENSHDTVLAAYHLSQFTACLDKLSPQSKNKNDPVWAHLKQKLQHISNSNVENNTHLIHELRVTIERFSTYAAYKPYQKQLNTLKGQLTQSSRALNKPNGLKHDNQDSLFSQKSSQFAKLFNVAEGNVRIQRGCDGIQSYIDVQVESTSLQEGFTGYQSSCSRTLDHEKSRIGLQKANFEANRQALLALSDVTVCEEAVPEARQVEFKKLFAVKELLNHDWSTPLDTSLVEEFPEAVQTQYANIQQLNQWDWCSQPIDLFELQISLGHDVDADFLAAVEKQTQCQSKLEEIQGRLDGAKNKVNETLKSIAEEEKWIRDQELRLQDPKCSKIDKVNLNVRIAALKKFTIPNLHTKLNEQTAVVNKIIAEETKCQESLNSINQGLDKKREDYITIISEQGKQALGMHLLATSKELVEVIEQELKTTDSTLGNLKNAEAKKSRYQTRRFFTPSDLLKYEATLGREETLIPKKAAENVKSKDAFGEAAPSFGM